MSSFFQDLRYGLRALRRAPTFSVAAILTLALGLGVNTVMFTVLNTVLLQPLPYSHPDRLVQIWETDSSRGELRGPVSPANFLDWQAQSSNFAQMATYESNTVVLSGGQVPKRMNVLFVSSAFFDIFDRTPLKGRTFLATDNAAENA